MAGYQAKDLSLKSTIVGEDMDPHCARGTAGELAGMYDASVKDGEAVPQVPQLAGDHFIRGLGAVLALWVQESSSSARPQKVARFHSSRAPPISIQDYIKRLRKFFQCSDECFVLALVYIDKVGKNNDAMMVCDVTVHRLLIIAVMLAAKFHDDKYYGNAYYAKVGGLCLREANLLEAVMLKALDWKLHVTAEQYQLYHSLVCAAV